MVVVNPWLAPLWKTVSTSGRGPSAVNAVDDPSTYMCTAIGFWVSGSRAQPVAVTLALVVVTLSMNPIGGALTVKRRQPSSVFPLLTSVFRAQTQTEWEPALAVMVVVNPWLAPLWKTVSTSGRGPSAVN